MAQPTSLVLDGPSELDGSMVDACKASEPDGLRRERLTCPTRANLASLTLDRLNVGRPGKPNADKHGRLVLYLEGGSHNRGSKAQ